jgi:hypothetical protein
MSYYDALLAEIPSDFQTVIIGLSSGILKIEGATDTTLTNCILDEPEGSIEAEPAAGQVIQRDSLKIWPVSQSAMPPLGSVLVQGETYWTILSVIRKGQVETWECRCRNLSIATNAGTPNAGLNTVTILKAQYEKGRANEAKAIWLGYVSGLSAPTEADQVTCRLQPSSTDAMIRFTAEWSKETIRAIFQEQLPINLASADYRILDSVGNRYRLMQYYDAERIDKLPCAILVQITEGIEFFNGGTSGPPPLPQPQFPQGETAKRGRKR